MLPLKPYAKGKAVGAAPSTWGWHKSLQLGDPATPFTLPRADGTKVNLADYRGKKNVIVTTYRAFW
jgi:hypothetical protein